MLRVFRNVRVQLDMVLDNAGATSRSSRPWAEGGGSRMRGKAIQPWSEYDDLRP